MSDNYRYRYGETNPVRQTFDTTVAIAIGDLIYVASNKIYPASHYTWNTNLATTQQGISAVFLGVAAQRYDGSNVNGYGIKDGQIRVDTQGIFEFACASASFNVGDLVGIDTDGSSHLLSQQVVAVGAMNEAIGRVVEDVTSGTSVKIYIFSPLMRPF